MAVKNGNGAAIPRTRRPLNIDLYGLEGERIVRAEVGGSSLSMRRSSLVLAER